MDCLRTSLGIMAAAGYWRIPEGLSVFWSGCKSADQDFRRVDLVVGHQNDHAGIDENKTRSG